MGEDAFTWLTGISGCLDTKNQERKAFKQRNCASSQLRQIWQKSSWKNRKVNSSTFKKLSKLFRVTLAAKESIFVYSNKAESCSSEWRQHSCIQEHFRGWNSQIIDWTFRNAIPTSNEETKITAASQPYESQAIRLENASTLIRIPWLGGSCRLHGWGVLQLASPTAPYLLFFSYLPH